MKQKHAPTTPIAKRKSSLPGVLLLLLGITFIIAGLLTGQDEAVFQKAVRICLECIGIG